MLDPLSCTKKISQIILRDLTDVLLIAIALVLLVRWKIVLAPPTLLLESVLAILQNVVVHSHNNT